MSDEERRNGKMYICQVVGKVVSTIKNSSLGAGSLIFVRRIDSDGKVQKELLVAYDTIGCGEGDTVLVTSGSNARFAHSTETAAIDLVVVGIVDDYELGKNQPAVLTKARENKVKG